MGTIDAILIKKKNNKRSRFKDYHSLQRSMCIYYVGRSSCGFDTSYFTLLVCLTKCYLSGVARVKNGIHGMYIELLMTYIEAMQVVYLYTTVKM